MSALNGSVLKKTKRGLEWKETNQKLIRNDFWGNCQECVTLILIDLIGL